jgi:hypothetical protein
MADQITREEFADHMDGFEQRLGVHSSRADRRLETIDGRLDAIDGRLDAIDARLDVIDGRLRGWRERTESEPLRDSTTPAFPAKSTQRDEPLAEFGVMAVASPLESDGGNRDLMSATPEVGATSSTTTSRKAVLRKANGVMAKPARGRAIVEPAKRTRQRRRTYRATMPARLPVDSGSRWR